MEMKMAELDVVIDGDGQSRSAIGSYPGQDVLIETLEGGRDAVLERIEYLKAELKAEHLALNILERDIDTLRDAEKNRGHDEVSDTVKTVMRTVERLPNDPEHRPADKSIRTGAKAVTYPRVARLEIQAEPGELASIIGVPGSEEDLVERFHDYGSSVSGS